ncbi:MAG: hypothetical protein KBD64_03530 [Gammaproteobacteria bacterium]|nr:hypothetical protein [Gammaproteobacteria bacterium]
MRIKLLLFICIISIQLFTPALAIISLEARIEKEFPSPPPKGKNYDLKEGILYEQSTKNLFKKISYRFTIGSLKKNLVTLAERHDWRIDWALDTDYDIPREFVINNKTVPEIFAESTVHLPIKTMFYAKNKMITVMPMYDKKESDFSDEYSVDIRK